MNIYLQHIFDTLHQIENLSEEQKAAIIKSLKDAEKEMAIVAFKLDRTEKVKRTTAILLEETIEELEQKRKAVEESNLALQKTLEDLKAAQDQLVQQEKLASLGQLTAGIAHEIKNPLNFVNNFSEVSIELVDEIRDELNNVGTNIPGVDDLGANNYSPLQGVYEILDDIKANLRKIHEHGSRANGIVTSMLQHSRGGSGKMEPTDLNALIREYVNLSFHGMRAGKNPINVDIQLDLDEEIGSISLIGEDFSRVMLNLVNNAFDAMRQKSEKVKGTSEKYFPELMVRTKADIGKVTIEVEDNGPGIPDDIKDKILQPFFTTKKGTEGTGLGLSITNDIVKAHGGGLNISSSPGSTIFKILLNK
jgi:signal transduction histidine kinase